MLFALHIEVAHKLVGMSPASFFEHATGLSHMTYRRGRGYKAVAAHFGAADGPVDSLLLRMMRNRGMRNAESQFSRACIPDGISGQMVYGMGLLDDRSAPATRELMAQFDASDRRLCRLSDVDVKGFLAEISPNSELGPDYCAPLDVSGFRCQPLELTEPEQAAYQLALTRRAHMALSFLAAVDHEMGRTTRQLASLDAMAGLPRVAVLLTPPEPEFRQRYRPNDPIARLVDLLGAIGHRARTGSWPQEVPSIAEMGARVELSGAKAGDGARFVRGLRSGKHPMTRSAFRALIHAQLSSPDITSAFLDDAADRLEPYLVAAHLLTLIIPGHPMAKDHLDRTGWREAYLRWWQRHSERYAPPLPADDAQPPDWLLNP